MSTAITRKEAAERAHVCVATIDRHIKAGTLAAFRPSPRRIVIPVAEFERWLTNGCAKDTTER